MCVVSKKHKFVFIHVPKTAGGSLRVALLKSAQAEPPRGVAQHAPAAFLKRLNPQAWDAYFTFSFVRNPWARLWSLFNFTVERGGLGNPGVGKDFDDYLMNIHRLFDWAKFFGDPNIAVQRRPQTDWLLDDRGELIVDFVGRYENLDNDLQLICDRLKLRKPVLEKHHHRSKASLKHYSEAYSEQGIAYVAEHFRTDIERFDYKFGD